MSVLPTSTPATTTTSSTVSPYPVGPPSRHPLLDMLCHGTHSSTSPLRLLRGQTRTLLHVIWSWYLSLASNWVIDPHAYIRVRFRARSRMHENQGDRFFCLPKQYGKVTFPQFTGIQVNMLPFIMGQKSSLPPHLHSYWPMILACDAWRDERGRVCYLTVDERWVEAGQTHRRAGCHIEAPGSIVVGTGGQHIIHPHVLIWGGGSYEAHQMHGGIYMASNVADSCAIWGCRVADDSILGNYGSLERAKQYIPGNRITTEPNRLYWITDHTPHESLPLPQSCHRQFFRVVTSQVSVWYAHHSTANPLVPLPHDIQVIQGNKFQPQTVQLQQPQHVSSLTTYSSTHTLVSHDMLDVSDSDSDGEYVDLIDSDSELEQWP